MASRPDVIAYDRHPDSALQKRSLLSNTRHQVFGLEAFVIPARFEAPKLADLMVISRLGQSSSRRYRRISRALAMSYFRQRHPERWRWSEDARPGRLRSVARSKAACVRPRTVQ